MTQNCYGYELDLAKPSNALTISLMFGGPNQERSVVCIFEAYNSDGDKIEDNIRGAYHSRLLDSMYVYAPRTDAPGPAKVAVLHFDEAVARFNMRLLNWPDRSPVDPDAFGPLLVSAIDDNNDAGASLERGTRLVSLMGGIL